MWVEVAETRRRRVVPVSQHTNQKTQKNMTANGAMVSFATLVKSESQDGYGVLDPNILSSVETNGNDKTKVDGMDMDVYSSPAIVPAAHNPEASLVLFFQVLFPFLISGVGMVFAGILLDVVQHWPLFVEVPETFVLVPALLGLKGNLEMTLASRLSTQANTGHMDSRDQIWRVTVTNLALIQSQAIVVTFLASGAAMLLAWVPRGSIDWSHATLLCASSLTTASIASFVLSGIMIMVILLSRRYYVNPDNVATPIAASLGDLTTLAILSVFGSMFLVAHKTESWLNIIVIVLFIFALPVWISVARQDPHTLMILRDGWSPIIFSMLISSSGGFVLETAMRKFPQMALFQPVINGVGGNLAAVHASRLSTFYHKVSQIGKLPNSWRIERFLSVSRAFFSSEWDSRSARVLLFLVVPGHIFFKWLITMLHTGENPPSSALFTSLYLTAGITQVAILLFVCQWLVALMWAWRVDPDNAAIPYLTALGDLVGTVLLFCGFSFLSYINHNEIRKP